MDNFIFVKLFSGQMIIGKEELMTNCILAPAEIIGVPTKTGYQFGINLLGYPFEQELNREARISMTQVLYRFKTIPDGLKNQYIELDTGIKLANPNQVLSLVGKKTK